MAIESRAILTEPMKIKLRNLREHMPGQQEMVYDFGLFLADKLGPRLIPQGFAMAAELALSALEMGVDLPSGELIINNAVGYQPKFYSLLRNEIPEIAKAVCPADFADGVDKFYKQVYASLGGK